MTWQIGPRWVGRTIAGWGFAIATFWDHGFLDGRYRL